MKFISLGFQCTSTFVLDAAGVRGESYPFDWALLPPKFVHHILDLLLIQNMEIETLVKQEYFHHHTFAQWTGPGYLAAEEYREWHEGYPYNKPYGAVFPHDGDNQPVVEIIDKYIRRFHRLKNIILDVNEQLVFLYISQSSPHRYHGNYFIDGVEMLTDTYQHLNNIYDIISSVRGETFDFIVLDTINSNDHATLNPKMDYNVLAATNGYKSLIPSCVPHVQRYIR